MKAMKIILLLSFFGIIACSKSGGDDDNDGNTPTKVNLVFPEKDKKCTEGSVINPLESTVNFQWNESQNTDSYEINLKNLESGVSLKNISTTNSATIKLQRGVAYEWFVVSKNDANSTSATSDTWRFYNQGQGIQNYAPFPAEAISPTRGKLITTTGSITLEWRSTDVDNDIASYEVFFGTANNPTTSLGSIQQSRISVTITSNRTYYWIVKTVDTVGNTSNSEVFDFKVQ